MHAAGRSARRVSDLRDSESLTRRASCARARRQRSSSVSRRLRGPGVGGHGARFPGFATKFYTDEGNFDLVGNNIPVFFIQDGLKFPDFIHAVKPEPDREIPQAQSAHDTFWDFVSLHPSRHTCCCGPCRIGPSLVRTPRWKVRRTHLPAVDENGKTSPRQVALEARRWNPRSRVGGTQKLCGIDPDFHRRDLHARDRVAELSQWGTRGAGDAGHRGPDFEGIDLLDATKLVPEELAPVRTVGVLTLDRNPTNYFAETEQVAFHPGHLVPGHRFRRPTRCCTRACSHISTPSSLDWVVRTSRRFRSIDLSLPSTTCCVTACIKPLFTHGLAPYRPNSVDDGEPPVADAGEGGYVQSPRARRRRRRCVRSRRRSMTTSRRRRCSTASLDPHRAGPRHRGVHVRTR